MNVSKSSQVDLIQELEVLCRNWKYDNNNKNIYIICKVNLKH